MMRRLAVALAVAFALGAGLAGTPAPAARAASIGDCPVPTFGSYYVCMWDGPNYTGHFVPWFAWGQPRNVCFALPASMTDRMTSVYYRTPAGSSEWVDFYDISRCTGGGPIVQIVGGTSNGDLPAASDNKASGLILRGW